MMQFFRQIITASLMSLCVATLAIHSAQAQTYNAASDFSLASNPNGVWSYGYSTTLGGAFIIDTATGTIGAVEQWRGNVAGDGNPSVSYNSSASPVVIGSVTFPANGIVQHPGPGGEVSLLRWTAPSAGNYDVFIAFTGQDSTTTDVHLLRNGSSLFSSAVNGFGPGPSFATTLTLGAGETLDSAVGFGSNGTFFNDSTGVTFVISAVAAPEPTSLCLLALGFTAVAGGGVKVAKRRRPSELGVSAGTAI